MNIKDLVLSAGCSTTVRGILGRDVEGNWCVRLYAGLGTGASSADGETVFAGLPFAVTLFVDSEHTSFASSESSLSVDVGTGVAAHGVWLGHAMLLERLEILPHEDAGEEPAPNMSRWIGGEPDLPNSWPLYRDSLAALKDSGVIVSYILERLTVDRFKLEVMSTDAVLVRRALPASRDVTLVILPSSWSGDDYARISQVVREFGDKLLLSFGSEHENGRYRVTATVVFVSPDLAAALEPFDDDMIEITALMTPVRAGADARGS